MSELWSVHTMEYLAITRNEAQTHPKICMNPENTMLSERSQAQKVTYSMVHLCEMSITGKSRKTESRLVVVVSRGKWEGSDTGCRVIFGVMKTMWNYIMVMPA